MPKRKGSKKRTTTKSTKRSLTHAEVQLGACLLLMGYEDAALCELNMVQAGDELLRCILRLHSIILLMCPALPTGSSPEECGARFGWLARFAAGSSGHWTEKVPAQVATLSERVASGLPWTDEEVVALRSLREAIEELEALAPPRDPRNRSN
ncbi:MAG TPA: hypothetical protein VMY40_14960 [Anaerolineae bacterium]|nr:hypothetical protein [Anaerolineae bacterium]